MTIILDGTTGITTPTTSTTGEFVTSVTGFKNRIINGAMVIDQRNAGASVTITTAAEFGVDRWRCQAGANSKVSLQQNAGSVTPPVGFSFYQGATSLSAYSVPSTESFSIAQYIEGFNTADLQWGTANAATVTLSFWVRSSLTGTFSGALANSAVNRSYPFSYTISVANTWEYKTITIAGDTSGTWIGATNGVGIRIWINLGAGTTLSTTGGAWAAGDYRATTSSVSVVGTNGATFYITGVQLEKGSTATSFDYRPYGTEFSLCQRYFETNYGVGYAIGSANSYPNNQGVQFQGFNTTSGQKHVYDWFKVPKRTAPTAVFYDYAGNASKYTSLDSGGTATNNQTIGYTPLNQNNLAVGATSTTYGIAAFWTASAEL